MHILLVTGEYPPMSGGVGAYTQQLARALCAADTRVSIVTSQNAVRPTVPNHHDGVQVIPVMRRWDWRAWRTVAKLAQEMRANWVHVQYQTAAYGMHPAINLGPCYWRRQGLQVAWTYHDLLVPYLFPKAGRRLRTWVTLQPARHAQLTIVTNEGDRRGLAAAAIEPIMIPIGSNIQGRTFTAAERGRLRQSLGYRSQDVVLGYFGMLNQSKGVLTLFRALHRLSQVLPDVRLLMIGDRVGASDLTNCAYVQEVEDLIARLGLVDHVDWTGNLPDDGVAAALNACDFLLLPFVDGASLRRGTLMAGLANGCAIVTTTPQAPLPQLVDGRDVIYVPPEDDVALAAAVQRLVAHPALAAALGAAARRRHQLFTWDHIAERHLEQYSKQHPALK